MAARERHSVEEEEGCPREMQGMQKLGLLQAEGAGKAAPFLSHRNPPGKYPPSVLPSFFVLCFLV